MTKSDLHPPLSGPGSDPVLYGVAAGLAALFPPVVGHGRGYGRITAERQTDEGDEAERD